MYMAWSIFIMIIFQVYWIDAKHHYIDRINFDGSGRENLINGKPRVPHPFSLSLLDDYLYFTDWMKKSVIRVSKTNPLDYRKVVGNLTKPMTIRYCLRELDEFTTGTLTRAKNNILYISWIFLIWCITRMEDIFISKCTATNQPEFREAKTK